MHGLEQLANGVDAGTCVIAQGGQQ
jgi:hypothetical protein